MKVLLNELQVSLCILMQQIKSKKTRKLDKNLQQKNKMETENTRKRNKTSS